MAILLVIILLDDKNTSEAKKKSSLFKVDYLIQPIKIEIKFSLVFQLKMTEK